MSGEPDLDIVVREPHMAFLRRAASRRDTSVSQVFGELVETRAAACTALIPPRKVRLHVSLANGRLDAFERLVREWGLYRSEIARLLIEVAMEAERRL